MTSIEIITSIVAVTGILAAFFLGWVAGAAHVGRLRRRLRAALVECADEHERADLAEEALERATGGTEDIMRAVTDAAGRAQQRTPRGIHHRSDGGEAP
ncbi:hypothetical protein [Nocardiopsis salina]|uniref:hypothetical protein n=1 Tax=Nocardiopsis salina TaxID=245836 RepID=UPI00034909A4|nr:hypothetical protein [Nocardiopsis salina]